MERPTVRLRCLLLSSKQRSSKLLQQLHCAPGHSIIDRRTSTINGDSSTHDLTVSVGCCHCHLYRLTIRRDFHSHHKRLPKRKAPNGNRWWNHWRHIRRNHSRSPRRNAVDVQDGEAPTKAQGALRGTVLPDGSISPDNCLHRIAHGQRNG
jgi:hypothetical protein